MYPNKSFALLILSVALAALTSQQVTAQTLYGSAGSLQPRENANNVDWAYNWNESPTNRGNPFDVNVANYEYVPMIWNATLSNIDERINRVLNLEQTHDVHVDYVLGFNEPELSTQANMSVELAIDVWEVMSERFGETDIKMVSPAVSGGGAIRVDDPTRPDGWLTEFMTEVETRNADSNPDNDLQVDAIAYHFYTVAFNGQVEANRLIDQIDDLWQRYQRPIWITEFAGTSFSLDNPVHSVEERTAFNRAFLQALIPMFDARPYVERVSWWQFGALGQPYSRLGTTENGFYTPSDIGEVYLRTTLNLGQTYDFATGDIPSTYAHYLKGSHLTNTGPALFPAMRAVDVIDGTTFMSGTSDYSFEDQDDAYLHIRSGATLRKQGSNTVILPGTLTTNQGTVVISSGTMQLENGADITGQGTLTVNTNGVLATSTDAFDTEVEIGLPTMALNQGLLHVQDGQTTISGELSLTGASEIRTDGSLIVSGSTTGSGAIRSTGSGTTFLSGTGLHTAGAQVSEGGLIVANSVASATGSGSVLVNGTGFLGGSGLIGGSVNATAGTVAPGIAQSPSESTSPPPSVDQGVVVDAIDFDFTGVQDDAPLTQTSTLSEALQVVSGLDFGPGLNPRNAVNNGNEFNIAGFTTADSFDASSAAGDYLTFTVAPVEGLAMQLQDATFEVRRNGGGAPQQFRMFNSITGFDSFADGRFFSSDNTTRTMFTANFTNTVPTTDPVEIRLYGWAAGSSFGNLRVTNVSLDASFVSDPNSIAFDPTGVLELRGNYTQSSSASLEIDLGGTQAGEFDQLRVIGNASLNGTLDVSLIDDFDGAIGQTFDIITAISVTGTFDNVIAPEGMNVQVNYSNSAVSLEVTGDFLLGDVNLDEVVNFSDIPAFISVLISGDYQNEADCNQDGLVDFSDIPAFIAILTGQ